MAGKKAGSKELSIEMRQNIVTLKNTGLSLRQIAKQTKLPLSTVCYTMSRFIQEGSNATRPGRGRKPLISQSDRRYLKLCAVRNRRQSLKQLHERQIQVYLA